MNIKQIENIRFAQGWLQSQLEVAVESTNKPDENGIVDKNEVELATKVMEMWSLVDQGVDALIRENNEITMKLSAARIALG